MAYVGRGINNISNASILDVITFTNSPGPYNLEQGSTAFTPISAQALVISVDGVVQSPSTYTIAAATITFDSSMSSASTNNFIVHNGVGLITEPADGAVTTAKLAPDAVTNPKIANDAVGVAELSATGTASASTYLRGDNAWSSIAADTNDKVGVTTNDTTPGFLTSKVLAGTNISLTTGNPSGDETLTITNTSVEYDDNVVQSNIAMLGFKVAVNGSLVRFNLVDQSIDEFYDTSGVDASASTNEVRIASGANFYYYGATGGSPTNNADTSTQDGADEILNYTTATSSGNLQFVGTTSVEYLVVGGGASGGYGNAGGGGAGGYLANGSKALSLTGGTAYTITVGAGGAAVTTGIGANGSTSSLVGSDISDVISYGGGGAGSGNTAPATGTFGSGGGSGYNNGTAGVGTGGQGYNGGGAATAGPRHGASGGGGGGAVGGNGDNNNGGAGGVGVANDITGTSVFYAGGGGGSTDNTTSASGAGGNGGGGPGASTDDTDNSYSDATVNTGGGGGGTYFSGTGHTQSGSGGSGIVIIRYVNPLTTGNLTLQSTDVTAESSPTYGEFVTLIENASGTATLNTDIKGYISRDSGVTFTQGTLANEGSWGTNKQILGFHDLTLGGSALTAMCYKIETLNQSAGVKETRVYATSIGWR